MFSRRRNPRNNQSFHLHSFVNLQLYETCVPTRSNLSWLVPIFCSVPSNPISTVSPPVSSPRFSSRSPPFLLSSPSPPLLPRNSP